MTDTTPSVLFVCVKNVGKSQMAAGLMCKLAGDTVRVYSAGTSPGAIINSLSAESLAEIGVDINSERPKLIDPQLVRDVDLVVTLGREAQVEHVTGTISRSGTPTSHSSAGSTASEACDSSATTSKRGSSGCSTITASAST
jgi:arsenate-mycothiol transferase